MATCPRCAKPLDPGALEGLCPRCLLRDLPLELNGPARTDLTTGTPTDAGPGGEGPPPELARLFPQMEILEVLGRGGMGTVYKARQVKLDRMVALKVLPPEIAQDPGFAERFTREARALARLGHPHIVGVHDFGDAEGLYYLVMEYVEGPNLRQTLATGRVAPATALRMVGELCSALQYAHEAGVVHRDIKPENVLLDGQGRVKVADFGLAKLVGPTSPATRLTATRQAMGTPHYMAPEQWDRPLEVDHRADIYSLGVVFYELLTGELPLGHFPPPSQAAGVDQRLDPVVLRAMERRPDNRYQHMSDLKLAVEGLDPPGRRPGTEAVPTAATPLLDFRREALITAGMACGLVAAVVGLELAQPYLLRQKVAGWATLAFLVLFFFRDPKTRYTKRLWGLTYIIVTLVCFASELTGRPNPIGIQGIWVWLLLFGFYSHGVARVRESFLPGNVDEPEDEDDPGESLGVLPGLTAGEERLRRLLFTASDDLSWKLSVAPEVEADLLTGARSATRTPPDDRVLGVLDFTDAGEASASVVFGCRGLYWCNGPETDHPGVFALDYQDLPGRPVVDHGRVVYLGGDLYLCPDPDTSGVESRHLAALLLRVRELTTPLAGADGQPRP